MLLDCRIYTAREGERMVPDYQSLMRPVLECAANGEVQISDVIGPIAEKLHLTDAERDELLPSGKQTRFSNRVHWPRVT